MSLVPKKQQAKRSTWRKPSITCLIRIGRKLLAVFNVEARKSSERGWNNCRRASNRGVCSRSPWGKDGSIQHKFLILEEIRLDFPSFSFAKLKGNWSGSCHFISLKKIYCYYSILPSAERWRQLPKQLVSVIKSLTGVDALDGVIKSLTGVDGVIKSLTGMDGLKEALHHPESKGVSTCPLYW